MSRHAWGGKRRRGATALGAATAWLLLLPMASAQAGAGATEPMAVATLRAGLGSVAQVFVGDYEEAGPLAQPVPLSDTSPGAALLRPGDALDLTTVLKQGVTDKLLALQTSSPAGSVSELMQQVDTALDGTVAGANLQVSAATPVTGADGNGFDVVLTISKTAQAAVALTDPTGPGGAPLTLRSPATAPFDLSFSFTATMRSSADGKRFWLTAGTGKPSVGLTAKLAGTSAYTFPTGNASIGVGDVKILAGSTVDLDATWSGTVADTNGDGRLTIAEPTVDGTSTTPGELTMPSSALTSFTRTGAANASIQLGSDVIPLDSAAQLTLNANLATATDLVADLTASPGDLEDMAAFTRVNPVDLVSGVIQYATMLRALQKHPNVDQILPLAGGRISDLHDLSADLAKFADDQIEIKPIDADADPTDADVAEIVVVKFQTIKQFADLLDAVPGFSGGPLVPTYDSTTQRLRMNVKFAKALDGLAPISPALPDGSEVAQLTAGDQLLDKTGLRALSRPGGDTTPMQPQVDAALTIDLPILVDLGPATPATADDPSTPVVEFETPMVYERFETSLKPEAEIELTTLVDTAVEAAGQIGFVPAAIGGRFQLKQDGTHPTTVADVDPATGLTSTPRITDLLAGLHDKSGTPASYPVAVATRHVAVDVDLTVNGHGLDPSKPLTSTPGTFTVDGTGFDHKTYTAALTNDSARLLRALNVDTSAPSRLLGRILDTTGSATDALGGLDSGLSAAGITAPTVPFLDKGAGQILRQVVDLKARFDDVRGGPTPVDLADLEKVVEQSLRKSQIGGTFDVSFALRDLDASPDTADPALVLRLDVDQSRPIAIPLTLQGAGIPSVTGSGTGGNLTADLAASLDFGVLVPLQPEGTTLPPVRILNGSRLSVTGSVTESPAGSAQLGVQLGSFSAQLGDSTNKTGRIGLGAKLALARTGAPAPGDPAETPISLTDYFGAGLALTPSSAHPDGKFTCAPPTGPSIEGTYGCASLPVLADLGSGLKTIGGNDPASPNAGDYLTVDIDNLTAPVFDAPDNLDSVLQSLAFTFDGLEDGFGSLSQLLDVAIAGTTVGGQLPMVGDDLTKLAGGLNELKTFLDEPGAALDLPSGTVDQVLFQPGGLRDKLATKFVGLGILRDSNYQAVGPFGGDGDTTPGATDIRIVPICNGALCAAGASMTELDEITVELELGQGSRAVTTAGDCTAGDGTPCPGEVDLPIDLGLPGLPLKLNGTAKAKAGWTLELGFGLSRTDGFFLLDNPVPGTGVADAEPAAGPQELRVNLGADLFATDGAKITGVIGFITMEATDNKPGGKTSGAGIVAQVGLDKAGCTTQAAPYNLGVTGTYCTSRILGTQLINGDPAQYVTTPQLKGDVAIDVNIRTGLGTGTVDRTLPSFTADFSLAWGFDTNLTSLPKPTIALKNIGVAPGEIFHRMFGEVLDTLEPILEPTEPVRDFLFSPIPVISDVSQYFGGPPVSMIDLAKASGFVDVELLKDVDALLDFLKTAKDFTSDVKIKLLDNLTVDGAVAQGPPRTPDQVAQLWGGGPVASAADLKSEITSFLNDKAAGKGNEWSNLGALGGGDGQPDFSYPIFTDAGCLVGLLLGNDCVIVDWRPDLLNVHMEYTASFGPFFGVLYLTIGGELDAKAEVGAGVSTRGVRMLAEQGAALDADAVGQLFAQSLFLTDHDRTGKDVPEFTVTGTLKAGAKFDALIVAAGVDGGITATFSLNLDDRPQADGRMHIDEIINKINTPICLFVIEGKLIAFLEVWVRFGICPFCHTETWRLAEVTLFEFSSQCDSKPPELAKEIGDTLRLNVGTDAPDRGSLTTIKDEAYLVRQHPGAPDADGKNTFTVSAFGYTKDYKGKRIEIRNALDGKDSFLFAGAGTESADKTGTGSFGQFTVPVDANLGVGDDSYVGGVGNDTVAGDGGDDSINVGDGTNTGWGDARTGTGATGKDTLIGGRGVDTLRGGPGNDVIDGGLGGDFLYGQAGIDKVHGGHDLLTVPAGKQAPPNAPQSQFDGNDRIVGGGGNDTLTGGSGADTLFGDEEITGAISEEKAGAATVDGEPAGNDLVEGGGGVDTVFAGAGQDVVYGGFQLATDGTDADGDHIQGNGGDDRLFGSGGDDDLWGGPDADRIFGDDGDDDGHGQSGHDPEVRGGPGGDQLWGGGGNDSLFGDAGADELIGDGDAASTADGADPKIAVGNDRTDGGDGTDIVLGDNGTVTGAAGSRVAQPSETVGAGDSSLGGGGGDDRVYGEGGDDTLYGGAGADLLHGNGGEDAGHGQTGDDEIWGDADSDDLFGGPGGDVVFGNAAADDVHGQEGSDLLAGGNPDPAGEDTGDRLLGGPENDRIYGDDVTIVAGGNGKFDPADTVTFTPSADSTTYGDDLGDGGTGLDEMHGQDGDDTLYGAEDHDQIFGELGSDRLHGQGGPDHLVGDRGTITPVARAVVVPAGGWQSGTPNGSPALTVQLVAPNDGSVDFIWGDFDSDDDPWPTGGDDHAWGGAGDDVVRGGAYDDHLEGNDGQDQVFGFAKDSDHATDGEDDIIGGSSPVNPLADPEGANSAPDEGEIELQGNGQEDVMAGDNAVLVRQPDPDDPGAWKVDPVTGGVFRAVTLLDTEKTGTALDVVSGGDYMVGNDENDRMFGEGGNDLVKGNAHDDLVEGDQGGDWLEGNNDEDDLVGGSSFPDQPDTGDVLWGGGGADTLAGDNACIVRKAAGVTFAPSSCPALDTPTPTAFHYVTSQLGVETHRGVVFHDLDGPLATEYGADQLNGGSGVDSEFGQDGTDFLFGDGGADFQHGNGDADVVVGDRPAGTYATISLPPEVGGTLPTLPALPAGLPGTPSAGEQLVGPAEADGQDDQFGGSNIASFRDAGDWIFGDGEADFQLGDNGELNRTIENGAYAVYEERYAGNTPPAGAVIERDVTRYDVGASAADGVWGDDLIFGGNGTNPLISQGGGDGDDSQWGQDGNDKLFGEDGNDEQFGELGDDTMWGGAGEDAMVGDRGGVQTRFVEADGSDPADPDVLTHNSLGPPGINLGGPDNGSQDAVLAPFVAHPLDRRTSLSHDRDGSVLALGGHVAGGNDVMRGGPGHDSMHGGLGNDHLNGDSGGDYQYGDDGADVMWGGRGNPVVSDPDVPARNNPGENGEWIDVLFGGYGSSDTEAGADIIDYQPRAGTDPAFWFEMVKAYADTAPENNGSEGRQHHHGTDWQYGGWDRDVLQGDVAANGPNDGDKLLDWNGAYNLYTHCNAAYGGWNDVRKVDPNNILGLEKLAYVTGATDDFTGKPVLADVQTPGTSAYREVAIVYSKDLKDNSGRAFSTTPGHFQEFICTAD